MMPNLPKHELACLRDLKQVADDLAVPILIVGAMARRLVFDDPNGIRPYRSTEDWDFGVQVSSWDAFHKLRDTLLDKGGFEQTPRAHKMVHKSTRIEVDLVPFGGLEMQGRIIWPESGFEMNVTGFSEAHAKSIDMDLGEGVVVRAATTPLQVALKFIAFADRKDTTDRDVLDLRHFMRHYARGEDAVRLYEEPIASHFDLEEDFDCRNNLGPFLLGYDVASACSPEVVEQLTKATTALCDPYSKYVGILIGRNFSQDEEDAERRTVSASFEWLHRGVKLAMKLRPAQP